MGKLKPRLADYIAHAMLADGGYDKRVQWPDKILGEAIAPHTSRRAKPSSLALIEAGPDACARAPDLFKPYRAVHPHKNKFVRGFVLTGKPRAVQ